jgi:trehalose 6-phosphate phosphatase
MMHHPVPPPPLAENAALFLDFDGTLASLQDNRDAVRLDDVQGAYLQHLSLRLSGRIAIISGREIRDLARRAPPALTRIGGHGLHVLAPGEMPDNARNASSLAPQALRERMLMLASAHHGVVLEDKGEVLALHYRGRSDLAAMLVETVAAAASDVPGYSIQHGKFVIEAKPASANKGRALIAMMKRAPFAGAIPVMVGDDATDEDAFTAAQMLGGSAVKVGQEPTIACHRLDDVAAVWRWLMQGEQAE